MCALCVLPEKSLLLCSLPLPLPLATVQRCTPTRISTAQRQLRATNWPNTMPLRAHSACGTYLTLSRLVLLLASAVFHCHACRMRHVCCHQCLATFAATGNRFARHSNIHSEATADSGEEGKGLLARYREVSSIDHSMF